MHHHLLGSYARLLTTDTNACARLFAHDAEFSSWLGSYQLELRGRGEIERLLNHVPRQLRFHAVKCVREGRRYRGELSIAGPDLEPRTCTVRFRVHGGQFTSFEVLRDRPRPSVLRQPA